MMNKRQKKSLYKILAAALLFVFALILRRLSLPFAQEGAIVLFVLSYLVIGKDTLSKALRNIRGKDIFDENFLMSIATLGAFGLREYPEAVAVMLFYEVGELFQSMAVDKSRKSIQDLMDIRPDYANVRKEDGSIEVADPYDVEVGSLILVKPGEKVPLDGLVVEGRAMVDTSALTGESLPRNLGPGDMALSGFINTDALLTLRVEKEFSESTASKIIDMVENAVSKKSKSETFITKFAKIYTPIVVGAALAIALIPPLFTGFSSFGLWLYRALSFLVVSCPCALVVSVPLSFFAGIGASSQIGILVKGSNYLEALAEAETVVFDKTGTLTEGVFALDKLHCKGVSEEEALRLASYAEYYSSHPVALSIRRAYEERFGRLQVEEDRIQNLHNISGCGIRVLIDGVEILLGNDKLLRENGVAFEKPEAVGTVVYLARQGTCIDVFVIADRIKKDAAEAIDGLRGLGVQRVLMLSGDGSEVVASVAESLHLDEALAQLLPGDKVAKVEELLADTKRGGSLVFVGDGINDAPVLARADVGVAMGGLGSDAAIEAADVVIMNDEPGKLVKGIRLAKRTVRIAGQNIVFALGVKILVLILAALGLAGMWAAVFADVGVTVLAIMNAMRNLRTKDLE